VIEEEATTTMTESGEGTFYMQGNDDDDDDGAIDCCSDIGNNNDTTDLSHRIHQEDQVPKAMAVVLLCRKDDCVGLDDGCIVVDID
jgi:hypothetical protein